MSENEGIRIVSLFVGILLCTTLTQTACAAWNTPNWNANAGNTTVWNTINENKTKDITTWNSADGSLPPAGLARSRRRWRRRFRLACLRPVAHTPLQRGHRVP